ncbi:MAG: hypothetical protein CMH70_04105 [Nitrosomonadaceae bacterium]|nr:hypothetical protein [Nitrosomonadaceae bacterium]|tara:strand:+ start:18022 stop:18681 length:660 start_codon:yes stop_codon:yes gene_type:complete
MARINDEQNLQLKKRARRRVVGAIVLVVIAVIVLPMLLEPIPKQEGKEIKVIFPQEPLLNGSSMAVIEEDNVQDPISSRNATIEIGNDNNVPKDEIAVLKSMGDNESKLFIKPIQKDQEQEHDETNNENLGTTYKNKASNSIIERFIVQLGAFSDSIKAKNQQQSLTLSGIEKAYTETINNNGTEITRVRVGPFSTYEAAKREQKKLKKIGVIGVVITM